MHPEPNHLEDLLGSPTELHDEDETGELYDDLYAEHDDPTEAVDALRLATAEELMEQIEQRDQKIAELTAQLDAASKEKAALAQEREILVRNISCLFKTAQMEIKRREADIKELRGQCGL